MSQFCGKCGAPLNEGAAFCGSCGASTQPSASTSTSNQAASPPPYQPTVPPPYQPTTPPPYQPAAPSPYQAAAPPPYQATAPAAYQTTAPPPNATPVPPAATKGSSPWIKIAIVAVVIIFVGGAVAVAGLIYVGHKVSQKAHEYSRQVLGETPSSGDDQPVREAGSTAKSAAAAGDACHLLSKEDVSHAIGVDIVETHGVEDGCSYFAKGTPASMAAKHAAAMVGAKGADKKTQGMIEQFAGAIGNSVPKNETDSAEGGDGNVVVFGFSIESNSGKEEMHLNASVLGRLGTGSQALDGIGDEAFAEADSMMMVRKGDKLIRIMYTSCPCTTEAIKPLAQRLVANL